MALALAARPAESRPRRTARATASAHEDRACVAARRTAHEREQAGRLREARESLAACARSACGLLVQQDCASRHAQLGGDIPTVIPVVTDEAGTPHVDVEVRLDGEVLAGVLDGRALAVDPGVHELSFAAEGRVFDTQKLLIVQGQRNRVVSATWREGGGKPLIKYNGKASIKSKLHGLSTWAD